MTTKGTHIYKLKYDTNAYANLFSYLTQTSYFALNHFLVVYSSTTQPHNQVVFSFSSFVQAYLKKINNPEKTWKYIQAHFKQLENK